MFKTIIIALLATVLFSTTSIAAGTMQYDSNRDIGLAFGESVIRFTAVFGANGNLSLEELSDLLAPLMKKAYYAGQEGHSLERMVENYNTQFARAYDRANNK